MITFVLFFLLLAAIFGVLGAVLKVTLILVLSIVLSTVLLLAIGYYWLRHRVNVFRREFERRAGEQQGGRGLPEP